MKKCYCIAKLNDLASPGVSRRPVLCFARNVSLAHLKLEMRDFARNRNLLTVGCRQGGDARTVIFDAVPLSDKTSNLRIEVESVFGDGPYMKPKVFFAKEGESDSSFRIRLRYDLMRRGWLFAQECDTGEMDLVNWLVIADPLLCRTVVC